MKAHLLPVPRHWVNFDPSRLDIASRLYSCLLKCLMKAATNDKKSKFYLEEDGDKNGGGLLLFLICINDLPYSSEL